MLAKDKRLSAKEIAKLPQTKRKNLKTENFNFVLFPSKGTKYAFLISSKLIKRAVDRNKLKRRITHYLESDSLFFNLNQSILIIVKKDLSEVSDEIILNDLKKIF